MNIAQELFVLAENSQKEIEIQKELNKKEILENCNVLFDECLYPLFKKIAETGEWSISFNLYTYNGDINKCSISLGEDFIHSIYHSTLELDGEILLEFLEEKGFYCNLTQIKPKETNFIRNCFEISFRPYYPNKSRPSAKNSISKGEDRIEELLKNNNIPYQKNFIFKNCIYKKELPFDFAIFNGNHELKCLIEYDGEQHFRYIQHWHKDEEGFKAQQLRDSIKTNFCKINNIKLIRIPYTDYNNIELILKNQKII